LKTCRSLSFPVTSNRAFGLGFDVGFAAVPELSDVEGGVEGCGRVSSAALPRVTRRRGLAIHTEAVELVAAGTRDVVVLRQESDREIGSPLATSNS
jgi:hypothetical protein